MKTAFKKFETNGFHKKALYLLRIMAKQRQPQD